MTNKTSDHTDIRTAYLRSLSDEKIKVLHEASLEILAQNDLKEECYATPAIENGRIYIRTVKTLYCFGSR